MIKDLKIQTALDGFSGTTRVSQFFKNMGYETTANDIADYSKIFGGCYLLNQNNKSSFEEKIKYLNSLNGVDGYFTENYGGLVINGMSIQKDGKKRR
jgi:adenine-specific DNA-methyltransferase